MPLGWMRWGHSFTLERESPFCGWACLLARGQHVREGTCESCQMFPRGFGPSIAGPLLGSCPPGSFSWGLVEALEPGWRPGLQGLMPPHAAPSLGKSIPCWAPGPPLSVETVCAGLALHPEVPQESRPSHWVGGGEWKGGLAVPQSCLEAPGIPAPGSRGPSVQVHSFCQGILTTLPR